MEWWMWAALIGLPLLAVYIWLEGQVSRWNTRIVRTATGARFESHGWSVEILRNQRQLLVKAKGAQVLRGGVVPELPTAVVQESLDAAGLRIHVVPIEQHSGDGLESKPTGEWEVRFVAHQWQPAQNEEAQTTQAPATELAGVGAGADAGAADGFVEGLAGIPAVADSQDEDGSIPLDAAVPQTEVVLAHVSPLVAKSFQPFAVQVGLWVEKLEKNLQVEADKQRKQEEERLAAEQEAAARAAEKAQLAQIKNPMERAHEQIAHWRAQAGFTGNNSAFGMTRKNDIEWFIDLDPKGQITLVNGDNVIHTTLRGASVATLTGELELTVLPSPGAHIHAEPKKFRVLKGETPDARRAWKERLLMLRDELNRTDPAYKR